MDTARYSAAQYRPKNILQTTVFKALPPLFRYPWMGKSAEKMYSNSYTPVPARPRRFSATPGP